MKRLIATLFILCALSLFVFGQGTSIHPYSTVYIRTLLNDETQGAGQTTLGLGTGDSPTFAGLTVTGNIQVERNSYLSTDFSITNPSNNILEFKRLTSGQALIFSLQTADNDGTDPLFFDVIRVLSGGDSERLRWGHQTAGTDRYSFKSITTGTGVHRPIELSADGSDNQLYLHTNGNVEFGGNIIVNTTVSTPQDTTTLGVGVTTFAITSNVVTLTGDGGGNTVATITGAKDGQLLTIIFVDANITMSNDDTHGADTLDLNGDLTSADDTVLQLVYDGTSFYEIAKSVN